MRLFFEDIALVEFQVQAPISQSLISVLNMKRIAPWLAFSVASLLSFFGALVFNQFFNDFKFIDRNSFLPAYAFLLISSFYNEFLQLNPLLFANILCLLSLGQLFTAYGAKTAYKAIYNSGFLLALAALFYYPYLIILPVLLIGLVLLRGFDWREWLIVLIGVATPFYLLLGIFYLVDGMRVPLEIQLAPKIKTLGELFERMNWVDYLQSATLIVISLMGLFTIQSNFRTSSIKIRKYFSIIYWLIAFTFAAALIEFPPNLKQFMILSVPLSFVFTYLIMRLEHNRWAKILNISVLVMIFFGQYARLFFKF